MTKSVSKAKAAKSSRTAKGAKRAPGNATALRQKANDNLKALKNPDVITASVPAKGAPGVAVCTSTRTVIVAPWQETAVTRALMANGKSLAALEAHLATLEKPKAKLASGVDARTAPHSAKAVADQKGAAPATKGKASKAAPKAAKNKAPSRGTDRNYKIGKTKNEARPDTWRYYMLETIRAHKDTASAKAAHAKGKKFSSNKLDFTWADQKGYITFTK